MRIAIFKAAARVQEIDLEGTSRWRSFVAITREGIGHIWAGYDHLLFLLALLLPSVLLRRDASWEPLPRFRPVMLDVLRVVTSFTAAHSITLSLAALQVVSLPSRFVESAIAASVIVAAVNNVVPFLERDRWVAAFALGLLHGFGFSATLIDLGLPRSHLVPTLFGFNLGVEIGQIAVVLAFLPVAFALRGTLAYRRLALVGGSCVITAVASAWLVERAFAIRVFT